LSIQNSQKNKIEIIPALLPESFSHLENEINIVRKAITSKYIQIDVVDGMFASTRTWPYNRRDSEVWDNLIKGEIGLPFWDQANFEIDLMVMDQVGEAIKWIMAGASRLIGHIESFDKNFTNEMTLEKYTEIASDPNYKADLDTDELEKFFKLRDDFNVEIVMSLNPATKNETLDSIIDRLDGVQFMGNDRIGYHGVSLDEAVLEKVKKLRQLKPIFPIGIDIGVNFKTLEKLAEAGVTRFSSGSTILKSENPKKTIQDMFGVLVEAGFIESNN